MAARRAAAAAADTATFSLTPARVVPGVIDHSTKEGQCLFDKATMPLRPDKGHDLVADELQGPLNNLKTRAQECGWNDPGGVLIIDTDPGDADSPKCDVIEKHGVPTLQLIQECEDTCIRQQTRKAQENFMVFQCLMNSLSDIGKAKMFAWKQDYTIIDDATDKKNESCNCLLKIMLRESHIDCNATVATIRKSLSKLDDYMAKCGHNVVAFNTCVNSLIEGLSARGKTSTDLLTNLFVGYLACSDQEFRNYIKDKENKHEEGEDLSYQELMLLAVNKCKIRKTKNEWNAPSEQEEKILALETKLNQLKRGSPNGKTKEPKKKKRKERKPLPDWMTKKPAQADINDPKTVKDKQCHWCSTETGGKCEGAWRRHKPSECKGKAFAFDQSGKRKSPEKAADANKKAKLTAALANMSIDNEE